MDERLIKGSHIVVADQWVDKRLGAGTFRKLTQQAGDQWKILLPMAWYDVNTLHTALATVAKRLNQSVEEITTEIAAQNAETDLRTLYRIFMRVAQPQLVLSQTPRLWTTYAKFATATAIKNERGHYIGQGDGFDEGLLGWASGAWRGFIPTAIGIAGGRVSIARILKRWRQADGTYSLQLEVVYQ